MRASLASLALVSAVALVASGCSSDAPKKDASGATVVQYWSNAWFPSSISGRKQLVEKYNQEHKGKVRIQYIQGDWDTGQNYIQSGAAAGGGIACVMDWEVGDQQAGALDWYKRGWVQDLRPYLTPARRALMDDVQWKQRTVPGSGAIPISGTVLSNPSQVLLYNPAELKAAGITPATADAPWTWAEFESNARKLTVDANGHRLGEPGFNPQSVNQWGYLLRLDSEHVWEPGESIAAQAMGKLPLRKENGRWGWYLDKAGADAYASFLQPIQEGITPGTASGLSGDSLNQSFVDGTAAIIETDSFTMPLLRDDHPDFKFGAMPLPSDSATKLPYQAGGEGMVIPKSCKTPKQAANFIFWMMQPDNDAVLAHQNGMVPANLKALNVSPFKQDKDWNIVRTYVSHGVPLIQDYTPDLIEFKDTVVSPTLMDVVNGKRSFADANAFIEKAAAEQLN
jgi:multiple sugar transport system substrate-binding protein